MDLAKEILTPPSRSLYNLKLDWLQHKQLKINIHHWVKLYPEENPYTILHVQEHDSPEKAEEEYQLLLKKINSDASISQKDRKQLVEKLNLAKQIVINDEDKIYSKVALAIKQGKHLDHINKLIKTIKDQKYLSKKFEYVQDLLKATKRFNFNDVIDFSILQERVTPETMVDVRKVLFKMDILEMLLDILESHIKNPSPQEIPILIKISKKGLKNFKRWQGEDLIKTRIF